jgi:hypothetical protein
MENEIEEIINKKGYDLVRVASFSHKDDSFLKVIIAKNKIKISDYVCWVYNSNDKAVYEGYYTNSYDEAEKKLEYRIS